MLVQPVESRSHGRDKFKRNDIRYVESERARTKIPKANGKRRDIIHGVTLTSFRSQHIRFKLVEGGSVTCCRITRDRARSTLGSEEESGRRIASISSPSRLARAFTIADYRFYVSLFVVAARRATATGVRGDIRRNCEGCERVETARATGRFEREQGRIPPLYL